MENSKNLSVTEALKHLEEGKKLEGLAIDFKGEKIKAMEAFRLGKAGIDVPDEAIVYDDADVAYDPEFDDYEWHRTEEDPLKERLTVHIEIEKEVNTWIRENGIEIDHLLEKLIRDFYSSNQMIIKE